jgi:hypothetical protein
VRLIRGWEGDQLLVYHALVHRIQVSLYELEGLDRLDKVDLVDV